MQKASYIFGGIFVLIGLLGFVPGNGIVGEGGIFHANTIHNIVHLVIGIVLLAVAKKPSAGMWLKIFGFVYLIIAILGFILPGGAGDILGIVSVNGADNWLHVIFGVLLLLVVMKGKKSMPMSSSSSNMGGMNNMDGGMGGPKMPGQM